MHQEIVTTELSARYERLDKVFHLTTQTHCPSNMKTYSTIHLLRHLKKAGSIESRLIIYMPNINTHVIFKECTFFDCPVISKQNYSNCSAFVSVSTVTLSVARTC